MPRFAYQARDRAGQAVSATLEAPSRKDAVRLLAARGLQVSSMSEQAGGPAKPAKPAESPKSAFAFSAGKGATTPLSQAMAAFPGVFDSATVNLIQAGEATGSLNDTLARLIAHLTEQQELQRQLVLALAYPAGLVCVAAGLILFFMFYFLPRLQELLSDLGSKMPPITQLLIDLTNFTLHYGVFVAAAGVFVAISFWRWRASETGRMTTDAWMLKLPLVGSFVVARTVLAFSQTLSVLLENGITASEALRMTERQIMNRVHRQAFHGAIERVLEGEALSQALGRTGCLPDLVLDRLAVGENTGNVVPSLKQVAMTYRKVISVQLNVFMRVITAAVMVGVFTFAGFVAVAIVSALLQASAGFKLS